MASRIGRSMAVRPATKLGWMDGRLHYTGWQSQGRSAWDWSESSASSWHSWKQPHAAAPAGLPLSEIKPPVHEDTLEDLSPLEPTLTVHPAASSQTAAPEITDTARRLQAAIAKASTIAELNAIERAIGDGTVKEVLKAKQEAHTEVTDLPVPVSVERSPNRPPPQCIEEPEEPPERMREDRPDAGPLSSSSMQQSESDAGAASFMDAQLRLAAAGYIHVPSFPADIHMLYPCEDATLSKAPSASGAQREIPPQPGAPSEADIEATCVTLTDAPISLGSDDKQLQTEVRANISAELLASVQDPMAALLPTPRESPAGANGETSPSSELLVAVVDDDSEGPSCPSSDEELPKTRPKHSRAPLMEKHTALLFTILPKHLCGPPLLSAILTKIHPDSGSFTELLAFTECIPGSQANHTSTYSWVLQRNHSKGLLDGLTQRPPPLPKAVPACTIEQIDAAAGLEVLADTAPQDIWACLHVEHRLPLQDTHAFCALRAPALRFAFRKPIMRTTTMPEAKHGACRCVDFSHQCKSGVAASSAWTCGYKAQVRDKSHTRSHAKALAMRCHKLSRSGDTTALLVQSLQCCCASKVPRLSSAPKAAQILQGSGRATGVVCQIGADWSQAKDVSQMENYSGAATRAGPQASSTSRDPGSRGLPKASSCQTALTDDTQFPGPKKWPRKYMEALCPPPSRAVFLGPNPHSADASEGEAPQAASMPSFAVRCELMRGAHVARAPRRSAGYSATLGQRLRPCTDIAKCPVNFVCLPCTRALERILYSACDGGVCAVHANTSTCLMRPSSIYQLQSFQRTLYILRHGFPIAPLHLLRSTHMQAIHGVPVSTDYYINQADTLLESTRSRMWRKWRFAFSLMCADAPRNDAGNVGA